MLFVLFFPIVFALGRVCALSRGLGKDDVSEILKTMLDSGDQENVMWLMSWNIMAERHSTAPEAWDYRKKDVCDYIKTINPLVIGLQEVDPSQLDYLSTCLSYYRVAGAVRNPRSDRQYNPIFYRRTRKLRIVKRGTFLLSKTSASRVPRTCTWIKARYAVREKTAKEILYQSSRNRLIRLLFQATGKRDALKTSPLRRERRKKYMYNWKTFFIANAQLDDANATEASEQLKVLLTQLKETAMDRRQYPVALMVDMNWPSTSNVYEEIERQGWLTDTMITSRKAYSAPSVLDVRTGEELALTDRIWTNGFQNILAAIFTDQRQNGKEFSDHRPSFAAVLA